MNGLRPLLLLACLAAASSAPAQSNLYRWVDKDGKVHFTDTPPPADAKASTQKRYGGAADDPAMPYATRMAMQKNPVMLWVAPNCDPCARGRSLLSQRGIPFRERDAQSNVETQDALKKLAGDLSVPLLVVGENRIRGFEEGQWNAALDAAGYPRERPYGQPPSRPTIANLPAAQPKPAPAQALPATPTQTQ